MAEIVQDLGFSADSALNTLKQLDQAMATFESRLQSSAAQFSNFNKNAGRTVAALIQITRNANLAATALASVGTIGGTGKSNRDPAADAAAAASAVQSTVQQLNQAGAAARGASVKVGDALIRIGKDANTAANDVKKGTDRMTVSFKLLSRIVFTQAIVRGLSQLRNAFRATVRDAIEFQRGIALVQTIDDTGRSAAELSVQVRNISDNFNIPLLQVTQGLYQTISNQITGAAESTLFLGEAAKFARSTNSTLADSVDLLSGVLKSYNLDASETDRVSSVLFKTIDLGRITATQLANAFGRVGPAAADLGIELEEVGGAIAAISVRGTDTAQSLTQMRNIITAITKPSVAMRRAIRELGFESGQAAIQTLGFSGTLRELVGSERDSAASTAALFPNIRGLNGVAALTSDNLETLANNIDEMRNAADKFTDSKFLQATATDAERVTSEVNKLKNAVTVDLGQAFLDLVADISEATGGVDNFTGIIKAAPAAIGGLVVSLIALAGAFKTAQIAGLTFSRAIAGLTLVPLAFGAGASLGKFIDDKLFERNFADIKALVQKNVADLNSFAEELEEASNKANDADKERVKAVLKATRDISAAYLRQEEIASTASANLVRNTKASVNDIVQAFDRLVEAERIALAVAQEIQKQSAQRLTGLQDQLRDIDFEAQTRSFSEAQKVFALNKRSAEIAQEASRTLANAGGDQDKINRGAALFQQAQKAAEQAQSLAGRTGDLGLEVRSRNQLKTVIDEQVRAEQQLNRSQGQRAAAVQRELTGHQNLLDAVRAWGKVAADNTGLFDEQGRQFSPEQQAQRAERQAEAFKKLRELSKQIDPKTLSQLGLADVFKRLETQLKQDPIRLAFEVETETKRIQDSLRQAFQNFQVELRLRTNVGAEDLAAALGRSVESFDTPQKLFTGLTEAEQKAKSLRQELTTAITGGEQQERLRGELDATIAKFDEFAAIRDKVSGGDTGAVANKAFNTLVAELKAVSSQTQINEKDFDNVALRVKAFTDAFKQLGLEDANVKVGFNTSVDALNVFLQRLQLLVQEQQKAATQPQVQAALQQLQLLDQVQARIAQSNVGVQLATAASSAAQSSVTIAEQSTIAGNALLQGAEAYLRASNATFNTPPAPSGSAKGVIKAFQKGAFLANGGFARGLDTIPAMLSPGESVINAQSTRKFFSQLQAMNAGRTPVFRSEGGSVTSIGDINVTVKGGDTGKQTARQIAAELQRELRRGTIRKF